MNKEIETFVRLKYKLPSIDNWEKEEYYIVETCPEEVIIITDKRFWDSKNEHLDGLVGYRLEYLDILFEELCKHEEQNAYRR